MLAERGDWLTLGGLPGARLLDLAAGRRWWPCLAAILTNAPEVNGHQNRRSKR